MLHMLNGACASEQAGLLTGKSLAMLYAPDLLIELEEFCAVIIKFFHSFTSQTKRRN